MSVSSCQSVINVALHTPQQVADSEVLWRLRPGALLLRAHTEGAEVCFHALPPMVQGELVRGFLSAGAGLQADYGTVRRVVQLAGPSDGAEAPLRRAGSAPRGALIHKRITVSDVWEVRTRSQLLSALL